MKSQIKLKTRLAISHITIVLIAVGLISLMANMFLEHQFQDYVSRNLERRQQDLMVQMAQLYSPEQGWDLVWMHNLGMAALDEGLILKVVDASGQQLFSARAVDHTMCDLMLHQISMNMQDRYPQWEGEFHEKAYPLMAGEHQIGILEIGFIGPYFFLESDLEFIRTLNRILVGAGFFSILTAGLLALWVARRLTRPILKVSEATRRIAQGHYDERIGQESNYVDTEEMAIMISSVDHLAASLEQQSILRKRLTSDVAHELRTPLSTVQIYLEGMLDGIFEPTPERLSVCQEEIQRLQRLVGDLEHLSKLEFELQTLNMTCFDLNELIRRQVELHKSTAQIKGIELRLDVASNAGAVMVLADEDKLSQVLVNVLSNSLKYTPAEGQITLKCYPEDGFAILQVTDTGEGLAAKDLPHVFERFYRVDPSRNRGTGGNGIGLTISKAMVEAQGGWMGIESAGLGKGVTVTVKMPLSQVSQECETP